MEDAESSLFSHSLESVDEAATGDAGTLKQNLCATSRQLLEVMGPRSLTIRIPGDFKQLALPLHRQTSHGLGTDFIANFPNRTKKHQMASRLMHHVSEFS